MGKAVPGSVLCDKGSTQVTEGTRKSRARVVAAAVEGEGQRGMEERIGCGRGVQLQGRML